MLSQEQLRVPALQLCTACVSQLSVCQPEQEDPSARNSPTHTCGNAHQTHALQPTGIMPSPPFPHAAGRDVVFHCATAAPSAANASNEDLMYAVNVRGTEHVVSACKAAGVPKLVYTSSASVTIHNT